MCMCVCVWVGEERRYSHLPLGRSVYGIYSNSTVATSCVYVSYIIANYDAHFNAHFHAHFNAHFDAQFISY